MEYHTLGRTGLRISDIGFGAMTIGGEIFGSTDDSESLRALNRALDLGMNFIDTADAYGRGHSEELIAQLLKTRRQEVVLATKGGNLFTVRQGLRNFRSGLHFFRPGAQPQTFTDRDHRSLPASQSLPGSYAAG